MPVAPEPEPASSVAEVVAVADGTLTPVSVAEAVMATVVVAELLGLLFMP